MKLSFQMIWEKFLGIVQLCCMYVKGCFATTPKQWSYDTLIFRHQSKHRENTKKKNRQKLDLWSYLTSHNLIFIQNSKMFCLHVKDDMLIGWCPTSLGSYRSFHSSRLVVYLNLQRRMWKWQLMIHNANCTVSYQQFCWYLRCGSNFTFNSKVMNGL